MSAHYKVMSGKEKSRGSHHGVTPQKIEEEIKKAFANVNTDGSGSIDAKELNIAMKDLGFEMSEEEINEIIAVVDKDGNGAIESDEFLHMMTSKFVEMGIKEKLMEVFHIIDQDKNGKISFADIQRIGRELNINFTENEIQDMVDEADRDCDGEVNAEEFLRIMRRTSYGY